MKIRLCYVSNSSSCSWIVRQDLTQMGINCLKLNIEQKKKLFDSGYIKKEDIESDLYLTQYISECSSKYSIINNIDHIEYEEGQLNETPRWEELYNEYQVNGWDNSVYLAKQHDNAKQMTLKQFIKYYKDSNLPKQFIVDHTDDGFTFKYIS